MPQDSEQAKVRVEQVSDVELVVTRMIGAPPHLVYQAWSKADLFRQWWVPKSIGIALLSCEMDVRVGGTYRLEFGHPASDVPMAFFGTYTEVVPDQRLVWTNEESPDGAITTVTFEPREGGTFLTVSNRFPSKEALEAEIASGGTGAFEETLAQLDELLAARQTA